MVGTNITALDNFFLYIEKNFFFFFSTIVLQSQRFVEKGAAQLIKKPIQNQTKHKGKQTKFMALVSTASPPVSDPPPPPGSSDTAEDLRREGSTVRFLHGLFGTGIVYTEKWGPTQPCTCSKLNRNKKWKSFEFCLLWLAVTGGKVHFSASEETPTFRFFWFKKTKGISLINVSAFLLHIQ